MSEIFATIRSFIRGSEMTFWRVVGKLASESYEMLRDVDKWT